MNSDRDCFNYTTKRRHASLLKPLLLPRQLKVELRSMIMDSKETVLILEAILKTKANAAYGGGRAAAANAPAKKAGIAF